VLVEIRIVRTVPGEPEPARTVLEDLGQRASADCLTPGR
jgi:hypothetical protein